MSGNDETTNDDGPETAVVAKPKSKALPTAMKWIGIAIGMFAIVTVSQIVTALVTSHLQPAQTQSEAEAETAQAGDKADPKSKQKALPPPIYLAMDPPLVVSFTGPSTVRFLQLTVEVMARDPEVIATVEQHNPLIRNNLLMLVGGADLQSLSTREGKEALRAQSLAEVQQVVKSQIGEAGVEDLYFTSFVVQ